MKVLLGGLSLVILGIKLLFSIHFKVAALLHKMVQGYFILKEKLDTNGILYTESLGN